MRVLHFVTGGFSGATKVAVDLITAHNQLPSIESLLVLRRKSTTVAEKLKGLDDKNIEYQVITGATHITTILELKNLCEQWRPDILVAHGFPEHLLGRRAGLLAKVPHLIQVEHNSRERYTPWKLYQTRKLSKYTDRVVAVSQGVAKTLSNQGLQSPIQVISNGIDTTRFGGDNLSPISARPQDLIMVGRYAKSKDHVTLIEAMHKLKKQGVIPHLTLVGTGRERYKKEVMQLVQQYALEDQIKFIDYSNEVDKLLLNHKIFVMSSRFEGLNLAVIEAMASGCLIIGSEAVGVEELINHEKDGFLFPIGDASKLAATISSVLSNPAEYQQLASAARQKALHSYSKDHITQGYHELFGELLKK